MADLGPVFFENLSQRCDLDMIFFFFVMDLLCKFDLQSEKCDTCLSARQLDFSTLRINGRGFSRAKKTKVPSRTGKG